MVDRARGTASDWSLTQIRVVVHENPYANPDHVALYSELFRGPYDERFGAKEGHIERLFCGEHIAELVQRETDLRHPPQ